MKGEVLSIETLNEISKLRELKNSIFFYLEDRKKIILAGKNESNSSMYQDGKIAGQLLEVTLLLEKFKNVIERSL